MFHDIYKLLDFIQKVFPVSPKPAVTLFQATLSNQSLFRPITDQEWEAEMHKDGHLNWCEFADDVLRQCRAGLAHLDGSSFVYYLGAFLSFAVRHLAAGKPEEGEDLFGTVVFAVTHQSAYNLARLKSLSDAQVECVIQFLQRVTECSTSYRDDARVALEQYWLTDKARAGRPPSQ